MKLSNWLSTTIHRIRRSGSRRVHARRSRDRWRAAGDINRVMPEAAESLEDRVLLTLDLVTKAAFAYDTPHTDVDVAGTSDDGRFVVLTSDAPNLVAGQIDSNNDTDVFLLDRDSGTISLISHTGDGVTAGNGSSDDPVISGDGSTVGFRSAATDLVAGFVDNNFPGNSDIFAWESAGGTVSLISRAHDDPTAGGNRSSDSLVISGDGSTIAFTSFASNLVSNFINTNRRNVFSASGGTVSLISRSHDDPTTGGNSSSRSPMISDDGGTIAFVSSATNLVNGFTDNNGSSFDDVFASSGGTVSLISHVHNDPTAGGDRSSASPVISGDGSTIAFLSGATDLISGFTSNNRSGLDLFASSGGTVSLISHAHDDPTAGANDSPSNPVISGDGSTIAFESRATDLVSGFTDNNNSASTDVFASSGGTVSLISHAHSGATDGGNGLSSRPAISDDGGTIAFHSGATDLVTGFTDNNGSTTTDVFASSGGTVSLISHTPTGTTDGGNEKSELPVISGDGSTIAFLSKATSLVGAANASPGSSQVYTHSNGAVDLASNRQGSPSITARQLTVHQLLEPAVSDDGRFIVFTSDAPNLVAGQIDSNNAADVFLLDRNSGTISLISHTGDGVTTGNSRSLGPVISGDGSTIAFESEATDLVSGFTDNNSTLPDVFASTGGTVNLISHAHNSPTAGGNRLSSGPVISGDGSTIAFESQATDLVDGFNDRNGSFDADVFASSGGTVSLISRAHTAPTDSGNDSSAAPVISDDGGTIAFASQATDLVDGFTDNNGSFGTDVFASTGGTVSLISHAHDDLTSGGDDRSQFQVISGDGSIIAFRSRATDLVDGFTDNNGSSFDDVFASSGGTVTLISHAHDGPTDGGNGPSIRPVLSNDGRTIAFESRATNLVDGFTDNNDSFGNDVFASSGGTVTLISHIPTSTAASGNRESSRPVISGDGSTIAFESDATDLVSGFNGSSNTDVFTSSGGTVSLISHAHTGTTDGGNNSSFIQGINGDGRTIALTSNASNLVTDDFNLSRDVFVFAPPPPDFGDAPDSYLTLSSSGGPRHEITSDLFLGAAAPDGDSDGFGDGIEDNLNAASDDDTEGDTPDDEDGVAAFAALEVTDTTYSVTVTLGNTTGGDANLVGWIDFDRDGSFDADEAATATVAHNDTSATLNWTGIGGSGPDISGGDSFARFRLTTDAITGSDPGGAASDGEVEDYPIRTSSDVTVPAVSVDPVFTTDRTPALNGQVNEAQAVVRVAVAGQTHIATNHGDGTWTLADDTFSPDLPAGVHNVVVTATDEGNNVGTDATVNELEIPVFAFDFGAGGSPVAPGYTQVLTSTLKSGGDFGWVDNTGIEHRDRSIIASPLNRDYHKTNVDTVTFQAAVPDGDYNVTFTIGSGGDPRRDVGVLLEGSQVATINTDPGQFATETHLVTVADGMLDLTLDKQGSTSTGINALRIVPATDEPRLNLADAALFHRDGDPAVVVDPGLALADPDDTNLTGATVSIVGGFAAGDTLGFTDQNNITGSYDGNTGVLTLSGTDTVENYQTALRSVTFQTSGGPAALRHLQFAASDGTTGTGYGARTVSVLPAGGVGLNFDFNSGSSPTEPGFTPVAVDNLFSDAVGFGWQTDAVANGLQSRDRGAPTDLRRDYHKVGAGTMTFTVNVPNGTYDVTITIGSNHDPRNGVGVLLEGKQVDTVSTSPGQFSTETHRAVVSDGRLEVRLARQGSTGVSISALEIAEVTGAPRVNLSDGAAVLEVGGGPVNVDAGLTVDDIDSTQLTGATVRIIDGFNPAADSLSFTPGSGISGTYNGTTGELPLTGTASLADYQTVLRSVQFDTTDTMGRRTVEFEVNDGSETGTSERELVIKQPFVSPALFDFGTQTSPVETGYTGINETSAFDAALGFGWLNTAGISSRNRNAPVPLDERRDYNVITSGSMTFAVSLPNGDYDVQLTIGSSENARNNVGVILEGSQVDTISTSIGQFAVETYRATVVDGRLDVEIARQGGSGASINALVITEVMP